MDPNRRWRWWYE